MITTEILYANIMIRRIDMFCLFNYRTQTVDFFENYVVHTPTAQLAMLTSTSSVYMHIYIQACMETYTVEHIYMGMHPHTHTRRPQLKAVIAKPLVLTWAFKVMRLTDRCTPVHQAGTLESVQANPRLMPCKRTGHASRITV